MVGNYFFIEGSALTAQIRQLRRADASFKERKLCPRRFIEYWPRALPDLGVAEFKRATFYFPVGDEASVGEHLVVPDHRRPGEIRDIHFKYCGQKLKRSAEFTKFIETELDPKWLDRFQKSEKGIDIEICCDALKLASKSQLERAFLLTNDDDFIPFCRTVKEFGANISLIHLSSMTNPNDSLLREVDSYDVVQPAQLQALFLPELGAQLVAPVPADSELAEASLKEETVEVRPSGTTTDEAEELDEGS